MAHFAELDQNNIVIRVIIVNNEVITDENNEEQESLGINFCKSIFGENTNWKQTSYNSSFRGNYAGKGYIYSEDLDAFYAPQPYNSWNLNTESFIWESPIPYPTDEKLYVWDENVINWITSPLE